ASSVTAAPEELKGMPQDWLAARPAGADGLVRISMAYPDAWPVMTYADSAELRKRVTLAFKNRAYPVNDPVVRQLIDDRARLAALVGYPSYAAYDFGNRMARTPRAWNPFSP